MKLMRQYRRLYAANAGERPDSADGAIAALDARILDPRHPRRLIGTCRRWKHWWEVYLKRVASRYLPSVYKALRGVRDKKASKG